MSTLLTAKKTGLEVLRNTSAIATSRSVIPVAASTMNTSACASSTAISTCFFISFSKTSSLCGTNPPVSIRLKVFPFQSETPYWRWRVTPLSSSTIALRSPSNLLKNVLFPTLGRPTIATVNPAINYFLKLQRNIISVISVFLKHHIVIAPFGTHLHKKFKKNFL